MLKYFLVIFLSGCSSVFHSILIMIQASTLNVAFNSHNKSLLTIMMSSNVSKHAQTFAATVSPVWLLKQLPSSIKKVHAHNLHFS